MFEEGQNRSFKDNLKLGWLFSFNAGFINLMALLAFGITVSHVTGTASLVGQTVSQLVAPITPEDWAAKHHFANLQAPDNALSLLFLFGLIISAFIFGSFVGTVLMNKTRFSLLLYLQSFFFFAVSLLTPDVVSNYAGHGHYLEMLFPAGLALVMGMQNSMTTDISSAVVRTTHLTGCCTDIGRSLGNGDLKTTFLLVTILVGFITGAMFGYQGFIHFGYKGFFFPAASLFSLGTAYS